MKRLSILASVAIAGVITTTTMVQAHHSFSMFDHNTENVVEGSVIRWAYNSPHTLMFVKDANGVQWVFEGAAPPNLLERDPAMDGSTFKNGDHVYVVFCPLIDGRSGGGVGLILTDDGKVYNPADGGCSGPGQETKQWPEWIKAGYKSKADAVAAGAAPAPAN